MAGTHWPDADKEILRSLALRYPTLGPSAYQKLLEEQGIRRPMQGVYDMLNHLGLSTKPKRREEAAQAQPTAQTLNEREGEHLNLSQPRRHTERPFRLRRIRLTQESTLPIRDRSAQPPHAADADSLYAEATALLERAQKLRERAAVGVMEADFRPQAAYPHAPIGIALMTDTHYGSINVNYGLLGEHFTHLETTPNLYLAHNGDNTDNFNAFVHPSGMFENPLKPSVATMAWTERLRRLGKLGKVAVLSFGNHDQFMEGAGYDWLETFAHDVETSLFPSGGLLRIHHGTQVYQLALTHMYWGRSKLNPTNANKRFMDFEYPEADISFLGHTHQSESLHFEKGPRDRVAVIGGTYKVRDDWARQRGIGGRSGSPGHVVLLWPDRRRMLPVKDFEVAREILLRWQDAKGYS